MIVALPKQRKTVGNDRRSTLFVTKLEDLVKEENCTLEDTQYMKTTVKH